MGMEFRYPRDWGVQQIILYTEGVILLPKREAQLKEELDEFQKEKERIRSIVVQIGGTNN